MKLVTSKGRHVDSPFETHEDAAAALRASHPNDFGLAILNAFERGRASPDQIAWIHILATPKEEEPKGVAIPFDNVNLLFATALSKGLKAPRLRLDGIVLRIAKEGHVIIVRTKQERKLLGRVTNNVACLTRWVREDEIEQLRKLNDDPLVAARVYGQRTGSCMFCGLLLTTAESVGSGYGPVCAENWSLPWHDSEGAKRERLIRQFLRTQEQLQQENSKS